VRELPSQTTKAPAGKGPAAKAPAAKTTARGSKPKRAPPAKNNESAALERKIEQAEAALRALEDELSDPAAWSTPKKSAASTARHEDAKRAVEALYERWEQVGG
jgi:hypothetical protein